MVSDAIPERNLMTFTKGQILHSIAAINRNLEIGTSCTDLRIAEADLGLVFVFITQKWYSRAYSRAYSEYYRSNLFYP